MSITPSMSCPSGGQFYACSGGSKFVGCCGANPCGNNGCAAGNLASTSFDAAQYGLIPDQECSAGQFYTCTGVTPPFWGCCKSNPCASGCSDSDLAGAYLSNNAAVAAPYLLLNGTADTSNTANSSFTSPSATSTTQSTNTPTPSTTSTTSAATSPSSSPPPSSASKSSSSSNIGAIAGGAVGGFAVLAALIFGLVWLLRRRRRNDKTENHGVVEEEQLDQGLGIKEIAANTKDDTSKTYPPHSPTMPSYPGSPQPPYSPGPPSYVDERHARHFSYELPGSPGGQELDGGQRYHAYRP